MNRHLTAHGKTGPSFHRAFTPQRKLISALTAAALLSMAAISPAQAAPATLQFAPVAGRATPSALSFHVPLTDGESVSDIRFQAGGSETSLLSAFELTPASGGVSARFLPALDFSPYTGQSLTLKVLKAGSAAGASEEQFQIRIIPASDLQQDLKLLAVTDGTAQADTLEFTLPGALNASLEDLLLMVSATPGPSVKNAFTLRPDLGGNTLVSLRGLDMDPAAGQSLEVRALKTLDGNATPLMQKLTLTPLSAGEFTRDVTLPVAVSGDAQPDPFTLALAAEANVEVTDITLGAASILSLFNLTRAGNGALSAQLATPLDFDPLIGQSIALGVRKSVAGASYQQRIILAVALPAPRLLSRDDGNIAVNGGPAASSTLRNPQYVLYSDAAGTAEAARSATGRFTDLVADTGYYAAIVAEALDPATSTWATRKSPLLAVSTQQANPDAFAFSPASGVSRSAEVTANSITVSGIRGRARISVAGGQYSMDNGVWTSAAGTVSNGQSVRVRATASGSYSTSSTVTLTIGARSGNFVVTTMAAPVVYDDPPPPADTTPPTTSAHSVANVTDTTADIRATIDETGTGYYIVQLAATAAPSVSQIVAGQDGSGAAAPKSGNAAMTAATQKVFSVSGLAASTNYTAYFVAKDAANNPQAAAVSDALNTTAAPDTTAPITTAHSVANITDTTADIRATIDEAGTGYYIVQLAATAAPSVAQIIAGQDGSGAAAPKSGNAAMTAATQKVFSVSGLAASTNYTAYFVAKDAANNTQAAAVSDALNTTADGTIPATPTLSIKSGDAYVNKAYADAHTSGGTIQVPVTISNDTDNVGVTGWFVSESSSVPDLGDFVAEPTTATMSSGDGVKTLYVWTRDAAGNISADGSDTIILDTTPPAAPTGLALDGGAATTQDVLVALDSLTTPPDADLAAWFVSESATAPAAGDAGWVGAKPTSYSFATATNETKTVCVYVKDTADNVQGTGACDTIDKVP